MHIGIAIARLILGLAMAAHGAQKLFGWFHGHGLAATGGFFEKIGFRPGRLFAFAAGLGEFGGGLLTAAGLFGPVGPALTVLVMLVAMIAVHAPNGFFVMTNGIELALVYAAASVTLAFSGPGRYSLDGLAGLPLAWSQSLTWAVLAAATGGAFGVVLVRRRPAAA